MGLRAREATRAAPLTSAPATSSPLPTPSRRPILQSPVSPVALVLERPPNWAPRASGGHALIGRAGEPTRAIGWLCQALPTHYSANELRAPVRQASCRGAASPRQENPAIRRRDANVLYIRVSSLAIAQRETSETSGL